MKFYDKIIRDKIPEIIEKDGKTFEVQTVSNDTALQYLKDKLKEEFDEFYESDNIEELSDIMEVIDAIAEKKGISFNKLLQIKEEKRKKRGGFEKNLILIKVY
ncbi:MAG TPA: nucleoside triphosphate pyrophosphohydrolase [Candidatus Eremiobacteraeota bacterium]|nr:nucleoside triphosphate pyrophosphohydrolase [Candidatus Eremiobacteraeota bacterium]